MKYLISAQFLLISLLISGQKFPDSTKDGKYYEVNGANLWTVSFGQGNPLLLIAGGPGCSHDYMRSFDSLSLTSKLIYFDALGRGKSDTARDIRQYTLDRDIEDVEGLRKAFGYDKIDVLGQSYGGVVAQGYALKYPQHVSHQVLANTLHSYIAWQETNDNCNHQIMVSYPEIWEQLMKIRREGAVSCDPEHQRLYGLINTSMWFAYNPENLRMDKNYNADVPINMRIYYQMTGKDGDFIVESDLGNFDYRKELKNLKMPVLILAGRFDGVAIPSMETKYKEYCPQAQFVMFEKSGHQPQIEQPAETFAIIRGFLKK